eukprot:TRINITY_DN807_c0_g1_i3.p2 TRINITY_DN807_c0_g1~~TRINITY_DN807_c0_g1_i3.p2  ORF type:complete len:148 (-),score=21.54 TRINITY_DN807_c0_g1_i3:742-1143(-)
MAARRGGGGNTQTEVIQQVERRLRGECAETARALQWDMAYACIAGLVILGVVYFVGSLHPLNASNGKEILDQLNEMSKQMNSMNASMHMRFTTIDEKFAIVDEKFAIVVKKLDELKNRVDNLPLMVCQASGHV